MTVLVFGSLNMDLIIETPRVPAAGETLAGTLFFTAPGGKGANQAVAAARLGAPVAIIGRVGADPFGPVLRDGLAAAGVDVRGVVIDSQIASGVALIAVEPGGDNRIIVVPGANGTVGAADVARLAAALPGARVCLLQLEVPWLAVRAAAQAARAAGLTVILDPAPVPPGGGPPDLPALADILTPNEHEAAALAGFALDDDAAIVRAAVVLRARGAGTVIITLGARGLYWAGAAGSGFRPAPAVRAVDSVGAGDAFNGALAVALAEGRPLVEALDWGLAAGALAVQGPGAQAALPNRAALETRLATPG